MKNFIFILFAFLVSETVSAETLLCRFQYGLRLNDNGFEDVDPVNHCLEVPIKKKTFQEEPSAPTQTEEQADLLIKNTEFSASVRLAAGKVTIIIASAEGSPISDSVAETLSRSSLEDLSGVLTILKTHSKYQDRDLVHVALNCIIPHGITPPPSCH